MKNLIFLTLMMFVFPSIQIALGQRPEVRTYSQPVSGTIEGWVEAIVINVGSGYRILDVIAGSASAKADHFTSWADAKKIDDQDIQVSYSFIGIVGLQYRGAVTVKARVILSK